jgi:hypothetical protein
MNPIVKILMERDGLSKKDAELAVMEAQLAISQGDDIDDVLRDDLGLEPDYAEDLL